MRSEFALKNEGAVRCALLVVITHLRAMEIELPIRRVSALES
jgi:hypothetical protein